VRVKFCWSAGDNDFAVLAVLFFLSFVVSEFGTKIRFNHFHIRWHKEEFLIWC